MQRDDALVVVEPIVHRRLERQRPLLIALRDEGEIGEFRQRLDVYLGERLKLFLGIGAIFVRIQPLHSHGGIELIERPGMPDPDDLLVRTEDDLGADGGPDMGMGKSGVGAAASGCSR